MILNILLNEVIDMNVMLKERSNEFQNKLRSFILYSIIICNL